MNTRFIEKVTIKLKYLIILKWMIVSYIKLFQFLPCHFTNCAHLACESFDCWVMEYYWNVILC